MRVAVGKAQAEWRGRGAALKSEAEPATVTLGGTQRSASNQVVNSGCSLHAAPIASPTLHPVPATRQELLEQVATQLDQC